MKFAAQQNSKILVPEPPVRRGDLAELRRAANVDGSGDSPVRPPRRAASSSASSTSSRPRRRRPRPCSPGGGAGVHLDSRSYERLVAGDYCFNGRRRAFFRNAMAALAKHGSVKTLTIRVEEERYAIKKFMFRNFHGSNNNVDVPDIVDDVICHPVCHGVEELHIEAYDSGNPAARSKHRGSYMPLYYYNIGYYDLISFGSIPSKALRHLHITNCATLSSPPPDAFFPCLQDLLLQCCTVSLDTLEAMVMGSWLRHSSTRCISTTSTSQRSRDFTVELDVPRVRRFRYRGKALKLRLKGPIEGIAVVDKNKHDELLNEMWFGNLERLEVDVKHESACKGDAAVAIGNLLQCCPALVDLRLNLSVVEDDRPVLRNRKTQLDFRKSFSHFMHRKDRVVSFGGENTMSEVPDIPGLSDRWFNFNCLRFYLKRVSLQFCLHKSNCFVLQLAKFFAERAMVLEEMCIDDGNRGFGGRTTNPLRPCSEYKVSPGVSQEAGVKRSFRAHERLPNKNSKHEVKRRNSWSSGFTILPLERQ
ncbi:hypothetical protein QOZ80_9BG0717150 [Eleusine coracana subsp. coracana]|nr:hypothetical protein QOZ80_9BG0717150 [Eleusine coracana subsp. coracana]